MLPEDSAEAEGVMPTDRQEVAETAQEEDFATLEEEKDMRSIPHPSPVPSPVMEEEVTLTQSDSIEVQKKVVVNSNDSESEEDQEKGKEEKAGL